MPFDFDQSGLVNAPYASTDPRLRLRRPTERIYRGFCVHNSELEKAAEIFVTKRSDIMDLFERNDYPDPQTRKRTLWYLGKFFQTIEDPKKLEKDILDKCRG